MALQVNPPPSPPALTPLGTAALGTAGRPGSQWSSGLSLPKGFYVYVCVHKYIYLLYYIEK